MKNDTLMALRKYVDKTKETVSSNGKPKYKMVPVDMNTYERLIGLVYVHGFGRRTQGALVRKLVDGEIARIVEDGGDGEKMMTEYFKAVNKKT